jgi:hypothetical protein
VALVSPARIALVPSTYAAIGEAVVLPPVTTPPAAL